MAPEEGYGFHNKILTELKNYLKPTSELSLHNIPRIVLEFGIGQEDKLKHMFEKENLKNVRIYKDMENVNRWITAEI